MSEKVFKAIRKFTALQLGISVKELQTEFPKDYKASNVKPLLETYTASVKDTHPRHVYKRIKSEFLYNRKRLR